MSTPSRNANIAAWVAALAAAAILGMAGFMKLSGAADSVAMFTLLGAEPLGRYVVGFGEITAVLLLLRPATAALGGLLAVGLMIGAIGTHLVKLGIVYNDDGGTLFIMAVVVLAAGATVAILRKDQLPIGR